MVGDKVVESFYKKMQGSSVDNEEAPAEAPTEEPADESGEEEKLDENFVRHLKNETKTILKEQLAQEIIRRKKSILIENIKRNGRDRAVLAIRGRANGSRDDHCRSLFARAQATWTIPQTGRKQPGRAEHLCRNPGPGTGRNSENRSVIDSLKARAKKILLRKLLTVSLSVNSSLSIAKVFVKKSFKLLPLIFDIFKFYFKIH